MKATAAHPRSSSPGRREPARPPTRRRRPRQPLALVRHGVGTLLRIDETYPPEPASSPCPPGPLAQAVLHLLARGARGGRRRRLDRRRGHGDGVAPRLCRAAPGRLGVARSDRRIALDHGGTLEADGDGARPARCRSPAVRRGPSAARRSAGRSMRFPSSASVGTSSRTTRSTSSASSLNGLMILFPFSSALPRARVHGEVALGVALLAQQRVGRRDRVVAHRGDPNGTDRARAGPECPSPFRHRARRARARSSRACGRACPTTSCAAPAISSATAITVALSS